MYLYIKDNSHKIRPLVFSKRKCIIKQNKATGVDIFEAYYLLYQGSHRLGRIYQELAYLAHIFLHAF